MKREEAIKNIKEHCYFANLIPRAKEALDMAIKALEQESTEMTVKEVDNVRNSYLAIKATQKQSCEDEDIAKAFQLGLAFGLDEKHNEMDKTLQQQSCGDCISRQAVEDTIINYRWKYSALYESIKQLPSVTPHQKMGHWEWVQYDGNSNIGNWHCSECRTIVPRIPEVDNTPIYKWCPMCGCKMQEVEE